MNNVWGYENVLAAVDGGQDQFLGGDMKDSHGARKEGVERGCRLGFGCNVVAGTAHIFGISWFLVGGSGEVHLSGRGVDLGPSGHE